MAGRIVGVTADPLPAPPVTESSWASIRDGHELVYLGQDMVLDWVRSSGAYRVWRFDRTAVNNADPFPSPPLCEGTWSTVGSGEKIVYLGDERVLVWTPQSRRFRTWIVDRAARGAADPLPGAPQTDGVWDSIDSSHELSNLDGKRILDWHKGAGTFRVWEHDPTAVGAADPLRGPPLAQGPLSVPASHQLVPLGGDRVVEWDPSSGDYEVWRYERHATGALFSAEAEVTGTWTTIRADHELVHLGQDRVLDRQKSNGHYRLWRFDRSITTLRRATVRVHVRVLHEPENLADQIANVRSLFGSYGIDVVVVSTVTPPRTSETVKRLRTVEIGECRRGVPPTPSQLDLFNTFREGVDGDEIVVYFISQTYPVVNGCARSPAGKPSAIVAGVWTSAYTMSHEVGHVLGLDHVFDDMQLMHPSTGALRHPPPDLTAAQVDTILASPLAKA